MKVRDVVKILEREGWVLKTTKGSHRQFVHPDKAGRVTVPGNAGKNLAAGTLDSVLKQARLKRRTK